MAFFDLEAIKKNRITLSKTLNVRKFSGFSCFPRKNGTQYLENNVLILIYLHLDITIGHNINT